MKNVALANWFSLGVRTPPRTASGIAGPFEGDFDARSARFSVFSRHRFIVNLENPTDKTHISWKEHGPAVEKNESLLGEYNAILERISTAAT